MLPPQSLPALPALPIARPAPRPASSMEAMTGIPAPKKLAKKAVRRGGGRMKPKAKATPQTHLSNLKSAMASGNHQQAKVHALSLANALHALTSKTAPTGNTGPQMPDTDQDGY